MLKHEDRKLEDSNIENLGGEEHRAAAKAAAQQEEDWKGAGQKVGLQIWRVENSKVEGKKQEFGVNPWPRERYGEFYEGDSYIILHTYKKKGSDALLWDLHFWLGKETTQDEMGVAAYKTVELDDLLDDGPVQHREVQGHESKLFKSYFGSLRYMEGGIDSGFNQLDCAPQDRWTPHDPNFKPTLFQVKGKKNTAMASVKLQAKSLNQGDVFILDAGRVMYQWNGTFSAGKERRKAAEVISDIRTARGDAGLVVVDGDDPSEREFWTILSRGGWPEYEGGAASEFEKKGDDVGAASSVYKTKRSGAKKKGALGKPKLLDTAEVEAIIAGIASADAGGKDDEAELNQREKSLWHLSDASGTMTFNKKDKYAKSEFDHDDVFIVDAVDDIFVWVGKGASKDERKKGFTYAVQYLDDNNLPNWIPISIIKDGEETALFNKSIS